AASSTSVGELGVPALLVVWMQLAIPEDRIFEPFLLREAEQLFDLWADVQFIKLTEAFVEGGHERDSRDPLDQSAVAFLQADPLANITNGADDHQSLRRLERIEADLDRELSTVFAQAE